MYVHCGKFEKHKYLKEKLLITLRKHVVHMCVCIYVCVSIRKERKRTLQKWGRPVLSAL